MAGRRYELLDQIGAGAHGTVWSAWDRQRRRAVVVKLAQERAGTEVVHRFVQERQLSVVHPHVISSIGDFDGPGQLGFVMEFADAGDLSRVVAHYGPFDTDQVTLLARHLLAGLDHLHGRALIHRDIKPTNVLFRTVDGVVGAAIGDLGTALDLDGPRLTTAVNERIGTVGFMAPEVEGGAEANERSDLYSLGRTLEFALTGSTRTAPRYESLPEPVRELLGLLVADEAGLRARSAGEAMRLLPVPPATTRFPGSDAPGASRADSDPSTRRSRLGVGFGRVARSAAPLAVVAIASSALTIALVSNDSENTTVGGAPTTVATHTADAIVGSLALGERFTCALAAGGTIRCSGPLGGAAAGDQPSDVSPTAALRAGSIWAGPAADGPCLATPDGQLAGCLTHTPAPDWPGADASIDSATVDVGGGCAVDARSTNGRLRCWGTHASIEDALVDQSVEIISIAGDRGCAILSSGHLWCWEAGGSPARGPIDSAVVTDVAVGPHGGCAVTAGSVSCWGDGSAQWPTEPRPVEGLTGRVDHVVVGSEHGCVVDDGDVACWGRTDGQSTEPVAELRATPVVGIDGSVIDLAAGGRHTCVRSTRDEVWCWGANDEGQIDADNPAAWLGPTLFGAR